MYRILLSGIKKDGITSLEAGLLADGHQVEKAYSREEVISEIRHKDIHLIVIDWASAPDSALDFLREIREQTNVPMIIISSSEDPQDMIRCLDAGADDFIRKPYQIEEVIARVNAQLRRYLYLGCKNVQKNELQVGDLVLNDQTKTVTVNGAVVTLTPLEYDILVLLMKSPDRVFTSKEIYRIVWNAPPMGAENAVAVHIRHIREKIEPNPAKPRYLRVVWGKGYKIHNGD